MTFLFICDIFLLLLICVIIGIIRVAFVVITIQGRSMLPTLCERDRVLIWRFWPARFLRRGQIIILQQESQRFKGLPPYIKRITGVPGDIITFPSDLSEHVTLSLHAQHHIGNQRMWHIPPGHLFVQGDNQAESVDSVLWGPISFDQVGGIVVRKLSGIGGEVKEKRT